MAGKKLVSIIIPVYNMQKRLGRCIESLMRQSYRDIEILVVNDGSTDESLSICHRYAAKDNRIIVIDKENGGVSSARNAGLDRATGEYVAFVDSDDYVDACYIERLYGVACDTEADIVECGASIVDEKGGEPHFLMSLVNVDCDNQHINEAFYRRNGLNDYLWCKLFKRELFENLRFSSLKCSEDFEILCYVLQKVNKIVGIEAALYYYVRNENSVGNERFSKKKMDVLIAREKVYEYYKRLGNEAYSNMIAVQILSHIISLYSELDISHKREGYKKVFLDIFRKYYPYAVKEKCGWKKNLLRRLKFNLFLFMPDLFGKNI